MQSSSYSNLNTPIRYYVYTFYKHTVHKHIRLKLVKKKIEHTAKHALGWDVKRRGVAKGCCNIVFLILKIKLGLKYIYTLIC